MNKFDELAPKWTHNLSSDLNLTLFQAAGLMGNLGFESGGFAGLQEIKPIVKGSRGGLGIAQWTGPRRVAFETWCTKNNLSPLSNEGNYGYLLVELRGVYSDTIKALQKTPTLEAAVFSVGQTYERPSGTTPGHLPGYDDRLVWARRALAGAQGVQSAPTARVIPASPARPYAMPRSAEATEAALDREANPEVFK